jgi:hypothetical protein
MPMSSPASPCPLVTGVRSATENNLLALLDHASVKNYSYLTGETRWGLNADEVCTLVEMAFCLFQEWHPTSPLDAWNYTARLLGIPELLDD